MKKRNFILLIIILIIIAALAFFYFFFYKAKPATPGQGGDPNSYAGFGSSGQNNSGTDNNNPADISGYVPSDTGNVTPPKLRKISSMPIAGYGVFSKERFKEVPEVLPVATDSSSATVPTNSPTPPVKAPVKKAPIPPATEFATAVRYAARATGNIYQTFADKLNEQKFTSTVIPKVYDAYFGPKAESVVMRYLKDDNMTIATFAGSMPPQLLSGDATDNNQIKGSFLPENISDLSLSSDLAKIFYLYSVSDSASGVTSGILGDKKVQVFSSPFTEWLSQWPNQSVVTLTTKPSIGIPGYMYGFDPVKKNLHEILGPINGLTTLTSPDGNLVLYAGDSLALSVYNIKTGQTASVAVKTMPEKCVWSTISIVYCAAPKSLQGSFPDAWYRGDISFSDQIWQLNLTTGANDLLVDPVFIPGGEEIDGIKLSLDKSGNYLFFINKKDSFLWEYSLK